MIQKLIGYSIGAGGIYLYTHDSLLWGILILILAIGVLWGEGKGTLFHIPLRGWFSTTGGASGTGAGSDGCGGGGDGGGGD